MKGMDNVDEVETEDGGARVKARKNEENESEKMRIRGMKGRKN